MAFYMKPGRGPMMKTGRGIPETFQTPIRQDLNKKDPKDGDKLPSYKVKSTKSVNTPKVDAKTITTKTPKKSLKQAYADRGAEYKNLSFENYSKVAKKDSAYGTSGGTKTTTIKARPASTTTVDTSETKTIGKETMNQVKKRGQTAVENRQSKAIAERKARLIKKRSDSTAAANSYLDRRSKNGRKLTAKDLKGAQRAGDMAAFKGDPLSKTGSRKQAYNEVKEISATPKG